MMPKGAKILHVGAQFEKPTIWVEVDPLIDHEERPIFIVTTGERYDEGGIYRGTFQLSGGAFMGHVFEAKDHHDH